MRWIRVPLEYKIHRISHFHRVISRRSALAYAWVSRFALVTPQKLPGVQGAEEC